MKKMPLPLRCCMTALLLTIATSATAETVINNYGTNSNQPQQAQQPQQQGSQNSAENEPTTTGPAAGAYSTTNPDGSNEQLYTTGAKKPFYVDNPNQNQPQPQVFVQPTIPSPQPPR